MLTAPGTRVFAVRSATEQHIDLYGHGVYDGRVPVVDRPVPYPIPPRVVAHALRDEQWITDRFGETYHAEAEKLRADGRTETEIGAELLAWYLRVQDQPPFEERVWEHAMVLAGPITQPRITLDRGRGHIWGCQCWWAPADRWPDFKRGRTIALVDLPGDGQWIEDLREADARHLADLLAGRP